MMCSIARVMALAAYVAVAPLLPSSVSAQTPSALQAGSDPSAASAALIPGDIVRLRIWREPDLSGEFPVDATGTVVFPKLGPIVVENQSTEKLKATLIAAYSKYLKDPAIEITMLRRVNVLGAVIHPGVFPVDPTMTVADVLALAGGATPDGDRYHAELLRNGQRVMVQLATSERIADLPLQSGDQLFVPERSWVARNQGIVAATISATVSVLIVLLRK